MRNIERSGLLFGLIVCLCCCVEVELLFCSNGAGNCYNYTSSIGCRIYNSDTQLVKELLRDCSNRSTDFTRLTVYRFFAYGNLIINIELPSHIRLLLINNYNDNYIISMTTTTVNTALTSIILYQRIEISSNDFFDHFTGLKHVYIRYISSKEPPSFKKLQSLTSLSIGLVGSETHTFDETIVSGLSNLVYLSFYSSYFNRITKGAFRNLNRLTGLYFGNNKITYIEDGAFTDCTNLRRLYLDNNGLSNISNNVFEGLSKLTDLRVTQNPGFPVSVLSQTRNLVQIHLNYNEYQTLDPYVFQQMKRLTYLGLNDPFMCDCKLQWISVVHTFGISIGWFPRCSQPLEFQHNQIYDTSVYSNCSQSQTYQCFDKSITCPSNLVCHNTNISYTCGCPIGYEMNVSGNCTDVNECDKETNCQHTCVNTEGSFYCICDKGYKLASNGYECDDVNECHEWNGGCEHGCGNTIGSYQCYCQEGHQLYNGTHCETNIECDVINHRNCLDNSFVCQGGFNVTVTNLTCDSHVQPTMVTIPATSATDCPIGFLQRSSGECVDEDECIQDTKCEHACVNTEGTFHCMCSEGYQLTSNQHNCIDVNECQEWNGGCEYGCGNTIGSYQCYCENGHSLKNETHCNDRIECELIEIISTDKQESSYICKGGYNLTVSGLSCPNVNSQQNTLPNETTNHTAECTSEPNLSTVQSESSLMIPLVLLMGISLITNFVFIVVIVLIIAVFIYFLRKKNRKGHGNLKHRIPEIQANLHPMNELALPEIPNDASFITSGLNNQDTQKYPLTMNEENAIYANLK